MTKLVSDSDLTFDLLAFVSSQIEACIQELRDIRDGDGEEQDALKRYCEATAHIGAWSAWLTDMMERSIKEQMAEIGARTLLDEATIIGAAHGLVNASVEHINRQFTLYLKGRGVDINTLQDAVDPPNAPEGEVLSSKTSALN